MINVEINGKLVGQCESAGKASSPLFKDVIDPWIEIRGFTASSPSLTDDQQVVLEWLKEETQKTDDSPFKVTHRFFTEKLHKRLPNNIYFSYLRLNDEQQFQVLAAFAEWGMAND